MHYSNNLTLFYSKSSLIYYSMTFSNLYTNFCSLNITKHYRKTHSSIQPILLTSFIDNIFAKL